MDEKIIMQGKNHRISDIKEELKSIQDGKLDGFIKKYDVAVYFLKADLILD